MQLAGVGDDARDPLPHVQVELDVLRQVRPRRLDHGRRELGGITLLDRDGELIGVEPAGDEKVVDDRAEPVRLGGDHAEQLLADLRIELDVGAADRLRRAVDRRQRRPQLVRDRGDEVGLHLLEPPLLGQVAEGVDGALLEAHARAGDPELAAVELDRDRLGPDGLAGLARDRDQRRDLPPAVDDVLDLPAERVVLRARR